MATNESVDHADDALRRRAAVRQADGGIADCGESAIYLSFIPCVPDPLVIDPEICGGWQYEMR